MKKNINWDITIEDFLNIVGLKSQNNPDGLSYRCYSRLDIMGHREIGEKFTNEKLSYLQKLAKAGYLLAYRGFGPKSLNELNKILEKYGLEQLVNNKHHMPYERFKIYISQDK